MIRNASTFLDEELTIAAMAKSLDGWLCADLRPLRNAVYKAAGFSTYAVKTYGDRAYAVHLKRLEAFRFSDTEAAE